MTYDLAVSYGDWETINDARVSGEVCTAYKLRDRCTTVTINGYIAYFVADGDTVTIGEKLTFGGYDWVYARDVPPGTYYNDDDSYLTDMSTPYSDWSRGTYIRELVFDGTNTVRRRRLKAYFNWHKTGAPIRTVTDTNRNGYPDNGYTGGREEKLRWYEYVGEVYG